jgi:serine/threonine-protein kinase HipA
MKIASQVYGINTEANALIFFRDGTPAYITKRLDLKDDGTKWGVEDFASLVGKTKDNFGANYKYKFSYEELGELIKLYVPTWRIELEKYFNLLIFNYIFSNGDAHLKNFSLIETPKEIMY